MHGRSHAARATWYAKGVGGRDSNLFSELKQNNEVCIRENFSDHFKIPGIAMGKFPSKVVCSLGCSSCKCDYCLCCILLFEVQVQAIIHFYKFFITNKFFCLQFILLLHSLLIVVVMYVLLHSVLIGKL